MVLLVQQISKEEIVVLVYFLVVIFILVGLTIAFFLVFQKRKNKLLIARALREQEFKKAIAESEHEIKEQTLKNIGMELHDNRGQLLSMAAMQLNVGIATIAADKKEIFEDAKTSVSTSLTEIRSLSKTINGEVMAQWRLYDAIEEEVKRLNKSGIVSVSYTVNGDVFEIPQKEKIIIFRIIQECCSNVIKHAEATKLDIAAIYGSNGLKILISDNGVGFDTTTAKAGSGLINMNSRANLINATFDIQSAPSDGTAITLKYALSNEPL